MNEKKRNRGVILAALATITFCTGGIYAWSVVSGPLAAYKGWDYGAVTLAYSLMLLFMSISAIPGGKALDVLGAKKTITIAAFLWSGGWFLTGFITDIWQLYITIGVITAVGSGCCYGPCITIANRWFPDKPGLASGVTVGATGLASLILAPLANAVLSATSVPTTFRVLGLIFLVLMLTPALLFVSEPEKKTTRTETTDVASDPVDKDWRGMLKDKRFYLLWLIFLGGCVSGLMLIGHASAIGQTVAGISEAQAALLVGIMAVVNFIGRIGMGAVSDKIGQFRTIIICLAVSAADMILMSRARTFSVFIVSLILLCVCFGGILSVFPGVVYKTFGMKNGGMNYGITFTAYGIAAFVGPLTATRMVQAYGSYSPAFIFAGVFAAASLALMILYTTLFAQDKTKNYESEEARSDAA